MNDSRSRPFDPAPAALSSDWKRLLQADGMQALAEALRAWPGLSGSAVAWRLGPGDPVHAVPAEGAAALDPSPLESLPRGAVVRMADGAVALKLAGDGDGAWAALLASGADAPVLPSHWRDAVEPLVAGALERDRLRQSVARLRQAEVLQRALYEITDMASSDLDMPTMLAGLHRIVGRLMYAENFFIALYEAEADAIRFIYFADVADDDWQDPDAVEPMAQIEGSLTWHLIRHAKPLMGPTSVLYRQTMGPLAIIGPGAADWLGVPIVIDGHVRGALVVQSYDEGGLYSPVERDLLAYVGTHIVTAIDRKRAFDRLEQQTRELERQIDVRMQVERRLQHEVLHDPLTGLPNRAYLRDHLARAMATQARDPSQRFAVLFLDLDRFKVINDSAGHVVGDELLKEVARRFSACLRPPDVVARLGGDEFAVVMHGIEGDDAPVRLAQRLIDAMREPFRVHGKALFSGVSVGIALGSAAYSAPEELLRDADIAMYRVKEKSRGGFEMFDERLHRQALDLLALESELRLAASRGEFLPHFQPIVRLADGAVAGYEALMRWNHPVRGLLAPGAFLRVAEASGVLEALDWQLYEAVFRAAPSLLRDGAFVNLNVSLRHFLGQDPDARLLALIARHGLQPRQVRIEITEGTLIDNPDRVGACIDRLRAAGVYTALDDFGTGYSSLAYLHRFGFHTIKLDRSFIAGLDGDEAPVASAVVRAVVDLARALAMDVIAEGIETDRQRDAVRALGCGFGQGYRFARPAPAATFVRDAIGTAADRARRDPA
ncbi:MAG TPA: EAL domain-containing protein [Lysobacter sp.]|nr:EAL domain-containing protein [Lysobacter sp.]